MRKLTFSVLAFAGSAMVFASGAMAQSEFGNEYSDWVWDEYDTQLYYTPPTASVVIPAPPAAAVAPAPAPAPAPGMSYFSPPAQPRANPAPPAAAVQVGPGPGECGTFYYWSQSQGRCLDARAKGR